MCAAKLVDQLMLLQIVIYYKYIKLERKNRSFIAAFFNFM